MLDENILGVRTQCCKPPEIRSRESWIWDLVCETTSSLDRSQTAERLQGEVSKVIQKKKKEGEREKAFWSCQHSFCRDKTLFEASSNILKECTSGVLIPIIAHQKLSVLLKGVCSAQGWEAYSFQTRPHLGERLRKSHLNFIVTPLKGGWFYFGKRQQTASSTEEEVSPQLFMK